MYGSADAQFDVLVAAAGECETVFVILVVLETAV